MKILASLILMFATVFSVDPKPVTRATATEFVSVSFSPFYNTGTSKITIVTEAPRLVFRVYIVNDLYSNQLIASGSLRRPGTYTYTYDNSYTRSKNKVYFAYSTNTTNFKNSTQYDRNRISSKTEYISNNKTISSDNTIAVLKNTGTWSTKKINHTFQNFTDLYVPDYYHKIDLNQYFIAIADEDHIQFDCEANLIINNYNNYFSDITGAGSTVTFPLKLVEQTGGYTLALKNKVYVHKGTLKMSSTKLSGYVETKHIFLPRNEMRSQQYFSSRIQFTNFSIDKDTLIYNFTIKALLNTVGDCSNSMYCVTREHV